MSGRRDDSQDIQRGLENNLEGLLTRYFPGWQTTPNKSKALLTPKKKGKIVTSSFQVELTGAHRGRWYRYSESKGGYLLALIFYAERDGRLPETNDDWAAAYGYARNFLGMPSDMAPETPQEKAAREDRQKKEQENRARRQAQEEKAVAAKAQRRSRIASEIFADSIDIAGTHGEAYLCGRDVPPVSEWPWSPADTIRFHPSLEYWEGDKVIGVFPAITAAALDQFKNLSAVWRIYLDPTKPKKIEDMEAKVGLGPATGAAVRVGGDGPRIGGTEGLETALSFWALHSFSFPIWAMLSAHGLESFDPPIFVRRIDYFPDGDRARFQKDKVVDPTGIVAARNGAARTGAMGIKTIVNPPAQNGDGNDFLKLWKGRL